MNKLLTHVWSVACSNSVIDTDNNNITLFNTLEKFTINVPESEFEKVKKDGVEGIVFPIVFEVVSRFTRNEVGTNAIFDYKVNMINPAGKVVINSERKIGIDKNIKNIRVRTNIQSVPVSTGGDYIIRVEFKDVGEERFSKVAELPIEIALNSITEISKK